MPRQGAGPLQSLFQSAGNKNELSVMVVVHVMKNNKRTSYSSTLFIKVFKVLMKV